MAVVVLYDGSIVGIVEHGLFVVSDAVLVCYSVAVTLWGDKSGLWEPRCHPGDWLGNLRGVDSRLGHGDDWLTYILKVPLL